jgi:hypothetical protein
MFLTVCFNKHDLFSEKATVLSYFKHNVSETGSGASLNHWRSNGIGIGRQSFVSTEKSIFAITKN